MIRVMSLLLTLMILLVVASCTATVNPNATPTPIAVDVQAQIYAAAIREIHSLARSKTLVYVVRSTEDLVYADAPIAPPVELPSNLQKAITAQLEEAAFELIWVGAPDQAPIDPNNGEVAGGDGILITLGNIHPQDDGSALLSFFMTCADMCGVGKTYVLSQSSGIWKVSGSVGPEIAS